MTKNTNKATASKVEAKAQQVQSGVVGSENTAIKVELFDKDYFAIANDDLSNRIGNAFQKKLDDLVEGDFNFASPGEIRFFVKAVNAYDVKARGFYEYLHDLTHMCASLGMNISITLNAPCSGCGIKQVFISPSKYEIITEGCYDELEGFVFTDETYPFACSESSNLYKICNKMFRSVPLDDFADVIFEVVVIDKEPAKLAEWIMDPESEF